MLNRLKLTLLVASILPLCPRVSRAQHWNDEEVKQARKCDDGFEWKNWTSVVDITKTEVLPGWRMLGGNPLPPGPGTEGGLALPVTETTIACDYPFLLSDSKWMRPLFVKMRFKSAGAQLWKRVRTCAHRSPDGSICGELAPGKAPKAELKIISLEAGNGDLSHYMSVPLRKPLTSGNSQTFYSNLATSDEYGDRQEIKAELAGGTRYAGINFTVGNEGKDDGPLAEWFFGYNNWGITWEGFNPTTDENVYGFKLFDDNTIEWYAGNKWTDIPLRVTLSNTTTEDIYPKGPLPLTFGVQDGRVDYAGSTNWANYTAPTMIVYELQVSGCTKDTIPSP